MLIAIGSDHVAYDYKEEIKTHLKSEGIDFKDFGCYSKDRINYPDIALKVSLAVKEKVCEKGILLCGTGVGVSITANKIKGIRAVVCSEPYSAKLSREHNDTNILALGSRVIGIELAKMIIDVWLSSSFEGGRHQERLKIISNIELLN